MNARSKRDHTKSLRRALARGTLFGCLMAAGAGAAHGAPAENAPIWRAQLTARTCDLNNAQTNDPVFASLRTGNATALDYGRDDFPRNNTFTYDLVLDGVGRFEDVTLLRISKTGTNAVCFRSLQLRLNNRPIFFADFGAAGRWLDGSGGSVNFTFAAASLRANPQWVAFVQPFPPFVLSRAELESRVEAMGGTAFSGTPAGWGHRKGTRFVEATRTNASRLHFDLDGFVGTIDALSMIGGFGLLIDVLDFFSVVPPDPDLDVDFNLDVGCEDNEVSFVVSGATVDVDTIPALDLPSIPFPGISNVVDFVEDELNDLIDEAEALVEEAFAIDAIEGGFADSLNQIPPLSTEVPFCPEVGVAANGDVVFSLS
jgi:hypothetical protein